MEMIAKVQEMVTSSKAELEKTIRNISEQFDGFVNQIKDDIQKSEEAMDIEIQKFTAENKDKEARINRCKQEKENLVIKLKLETDIDLKSAKDKFDKEIEVVDKCVQESLEKLSMFYNKAQANVTKIIEENKDNSLEIPKKLAEQVEPMQKEFTIMREQVASSLKSNYEKCQVILKELEGKVNTIEGKTKKKYAEIIQKFKCCVDKQK